MMTKAPHCICAPNYEARRWGFMSIIKPWNTAHGMDADHPLSTQTTISSMRHKCMQTHATCHHLQTKGRQIKKQEPAQLLIDTYHIQISQKAQGCMTLIIITNSVQKLIHRYMGIFSYLLICFVHKQTASQKKYLLGKLWEFSETL